MFDKTYLEVLPNLGRSFVDQIATFKSTILEYYDSQDFVSADNSYECTRRNATTGKQILTVHCIVFFFVLLRTCQKQNKSAEPIHP